MGNSAVVNQSNRVLSHYGPDFTGGYIGADANWKEVFDSRSGLQPEQAEQFRIFNLQTLLGNYTLPNGETTGRKCAILGRLTWGIGGAQMQVDFDWKLGGQMSVGASFIRVEAAFSETVVSPDDVRVIAMFSSGSRAARSQVTRSYPQLITSNEGDPVEVNVFPIPPFAHALNLFALEPEFYETGGIQVRFLGGASAGFSAVSTDLESFITDGIPFLQALATEDGVRFPEAAKFVEVSTVLATSTFHYTPCFTLNL
jgi:hypothetical protein